MKQTIPQDIQDATWEKYPLPDASLPTAQQIEVIAKAIGYAEGRMDERAAQEEFINKVWQETFGKPIDFSRASDVDVIKSAIDKTSKIS